MIETVASFGQNLIHLAFPFSASLQNLKAPCTFGETAKAFSHWDQFNLKFVSSFYNFVLNLI